MIVVVLLVILGLAGVATWKAPRLTSAILWSLVATLFLGAASLIVMPGPFSEKALWLTLAVPVLWAGLQFWTYWEKRPWVVVTGLLTMSVLSGAVIVFFEPVV